MQQAIVDWKRRHARDPLLRRLEAAQPCAWFNPRVRPAVMALPEVGLDVADIDAAAGRFARFAPYLAQVFPDTRPVHGIIESPLAAAPALQQRLGVRAGVALPGRLMLKLDSRLPVSGSIKARGGIYAVLEHAEALALDHRLLTAGGDYRTLDTEAARACFGSYRIAVGSTGNLGLSIGIMGARLGFQVDVHMSADARPWKKDRLRASGVNVIEYAADYSAAVARGRAAAQSDPRTYFIDDENSTALFLGYAVAARRLAAQIAAADVVVDGAHPLFVHLPCGVGGGPGGVAFGLKMVFGDAVHCIFAEPTHAPCMLLGVYSGLHDRIAVHDIGLDGRTAADGLAVGRPSAFVGQRMQHLIDGYCTVDDDALFRQLALAHDAEGVAMEPSAAAGLSGPWRVLEAADYRARTGLDDAVMRRATHVAWITGGSMVPEGEMAAFMARGERLLR